MTVKEAKDFIREFQSKFFNDAIDIWTDENEKYLIGIFEVMSFALKNLVPDEELDDNRNKCKDDCPFFTVENRAICEKLCPEQNCYQCLVKNFELMKVNLELCKKEETELLDAKEKIHSLENEILKLKAALYDQSRSEQE